MKTEFTILLFLYITAATSIAIYARKSIRTQEDYFIGGRNIGGIVSALTYAATTYSAFMMVGLVGFTYSTGIGSAGFELMYLEKNIQLTFQNGVLLTAFLVAVWALLGGLRGVAWTDALQGLIMLLSAILAVLWIYQWGFGFDNSAFMEGLRNAEGILEFPNSFWTPLKFASFVVPWFFFSLCNIRIHLHSSDNVYGTRAQSSDGERSIS